MARWSKEQIFFMKWLNLHPSERAKNLPDQKAVAEAMGLHYNTLTNWRKLPGWKEAEKRAAYLVMEDFHPTALMKIRLLIRQAPELRDMADYTRFIFPLMEAAKTSGYLDELTVDEKDAYLPREVVEQELDKLPLEVQKLFVDFLERLDYLKGEQAIVDVEGGEELELYLPADETKEVIVNSSRRRFRWANPKERELPEPETFERGEKRYKTSDKTREIEL